MVGCVWPTLGIGWLSSLLVSMADVLVATGIWAFGGAACAATIGDVVFALGDVCVCLMAGVVGFLTAASGGLSEPRFVPGC